MSSLPPNYAEEPQTPCQKCGALMLREMRFCRLCGYRLGEGSAEYTETIRLNHKVETPPANQGPRDAGASSFPPPFSAAQDPQFVTPAGGHQVPSQIRRRGGKRAWLAVAALVGMTLVTGSILQFSNSQISEHRSRPQPRAYLGVSDLEDAEGGGALVAAVSPPGGPLDRAGLVGGDVIKEFDSHPITDEDVLSELLQNTPETKTTTITFARDGQVSQVTITTATKDEIDRLHEAARGRPEGRGYLGISDFERVPLPGGQAYGIQIGDVRSNRPADIAGLRGGDIVTAFDGVPIRTERELRLRAERALPGSTISLTILRGGETLTIPVKMGRD